jgi:hypothetical protein
MEQVATARVNGAQLPVDCLSTALPLPASGDGTPAEPPKAKPKRAKGAGPWYAFAAVATTVSIDTSWRFFAEILGIPDDTGERWIMFAVLELALFACGWSMRAAVKRKEPPGPARILAWVVCGMSAYMALSLSGPEAGIARVLLGPVAAVIGLHMALGVEIRVASGGEKTGTWARIGRELRERALSLLGLGDDKRDAATRTADRALHRAARLAAARRTPCRTSRLMKAVRKSGAATDTKRRQQLVTETAALRHVEDLATTEWRSPWLSDADTTTDIMPDTNADIAPTNVGRETAVSAGQPMSATDTTTDIMSDTNAPDMAPLPRRPVGHNPRHVAPATRTSRRSSRGQDTRARVARLVAKTPDITSVAVAAQLAISERQALRHLTAIRTDTNGATS